MGREVRVPDGARAAVASCAAEGVIYEGGVMRGGGGGRGDCGGAWGGVGHRK